MRPNSLSNSISNYLLDNLYILINSFEYLLLLRMNVLLFHFTWFKRLDRSLYRILPRFILRTGLSNNRHITAKSIQTINFLRIDLAGTCGVELASC